MRSKMHCGPWLVKLISTGLLVAGSVCAAEISSGAKEVWRCSGFQQPESIVFDQERHLFYVSNMIGAAEVADGVGAISKVSQTGQMIDASWVVGLNAPKGMAIIGDMLYVADLKEVVRVDLGTGQIVHRISAPGSVGLNDVAASSDGRVFVSDVFGNALYVIENDEAKLWLKNSRLSAPNGVATDADHVYVGSWGHITSGIETDVPGSVLSINKVTRSIETITPGIGNIDGLEVEDANHFLLTDFIRGELIRVDRAQKWTTLAHLKRGSADITYVAASRLVLVPEMLTDEVVALSVDAPLADKSDISESLKIAQ